jgi:hypothetical protein
MDGAMRNSNHNLSENHSISVEVQIDLHRGVPEECIAEIVHIFRKLADRIEKAEGDDDGEILDANGNVVGYFDCFLQKLDG